MPIYEYRCDVCGHYLDALQKIADAPLRDCPACGASALRRLVSAPNFRLKGSGWYETDFKSDKEVKRNLVDRPDDASGPKDKGESATGDGKSGKGGGESGKGGGKPEKRGSESGRSGGSRPDKATNNAGAGSKSSSRPDRRSDSAAA